MPRVQRMVRSAGDKDARPGVQVPTLPVRQRPSVFLERGRGEVPAEWPFPTYRGQPIRPLRQETRTERLNKLEDALL